MQISGAKTIVFTFAGLIAAGLLLPSLTAQIRNPIQAAKDAIEKAKAEQQQRQQQQRQQQQQQQQQRGQQQNPQTPPQPGNTQNQAPAQGGSSSAPVTLEDLNGGSAPAAAAAPGAPVVLDPKKLPDIVGVHLGMSLQEAIDTLKPQYPQAPFFPWQQNPLPVNIPQKQVVYSVSVNRGRAGGAVKGEEIYFNVAEPPNMQVVWSVWRMAVMQHVNRGTLLTALREKYGKESVAYRNGGDAPANDRQILDMYWLFDEQGRRVPLPGSWNSSGQACGLAPREGQVLDDKWIKDPGPNGMDPWCASSYVGVHAEISSFSDPDIIETMIVEVTDIPLARRAAKVTAAWRQAELEKLRQQEIEKSKQTKPKL